MIKMIKKTIQQKMDCTINIVDQAEILKTIGLDTN